MYKFGLKLWSINKNYIDTAKKLYDENIYDYIELYAIPSSFDEYAHIWKSLNIPYIICTALIFLLKKNCRII